jgi:hypothetical protein
LLANLSPLLGLAGQRTLAALLHPRKRKILNEREEEKKKKKKKRKQPPHTYSFTYIFVVFLFGLIVLFSIWSLKMDLSALVGLLAKKEERRRKEKITHRTPHHLPPPFSQNPKQAF